MQIADNGPYGFQDDKSLKIMDKGLTKHLAPLCLTDIQKIDQRRQEQALSH